MAIAALAACGTAAASEDYDLRYAPGIGGADMSAPFEGGWVFQAPVYVYSGNIRTTSTITTPFSTIHAINPAVPAIPGAYTLTTVNANTQINVYGLLPRLSYMSSATFLGATVGATLLLPLVNKKNNSRVTGVSTVGVSPLPALNNAAIAAAINPLAAGQAAGIANGNSNADFGTGDPEISPILRWSTEATQTLFILTAVAPLGDYDPSRAANPSAGKFWTFRPAVQFSYIGDGWDMGIRGAFSYNTRNTETHYKTGNYVNVDFTLMKSVSDSTRVGIAAYGVDQTTRDNRTAVPTDPVMKARQDVTVDQKGHVAGVGPEIAYIHGAGDYLIDGRIMKEFSAVTRPKGFTAVVTLSKPF
ncbi:MAG: transporter [Betaproteobacteria bacterium]